MPDIDRLIEAWEIFLDSNPYEICDGREFRAIKEPEYCMGQMIEDTIALLKEQETKILSNWIKCSDRMPEEHDSIFAKLKGTDKWRSAMFEKSSDDVRIVEVFEDGTRRVYHSHTIDGKWDIEKQPLKRTVTHWMPNPKLPNEGR